MTILLISDPIPLNAEIEAFRRDNHFPVRHEFKFYSTPDRVRRRFLHLLLKHECLVRCLVIDKYLVVGDQSRGQEQFYDVIVKTLHHDNGRLQEATLIVDKQDNGRSGQRLATSLRRALNRDTNRKIADITYHESHRDNLRQAVDMVSGAINASYTKGNTEFLDIIRARVEDIRDFDPYAR